MDILNQMWESAYPLSEIDDEAGVWVKVLNSVGCESVRMLDLSTIRGIQFPKEIYYLESFFKIRSVCLIYPIGFYRATGWGFRDLQGKSFSVYNLNSLQIYTTWRAYQGGLKYNTPIIISEGVKDSEVVGLFHPYSFACLTSKVSTNLAEFLSFFTTRVLFIPDNDSAGREGAKGTEKNFKKFGVTIQLHHLKMFKDVSEAYERLLENRDSQAEIELRSLESRIIGFIGG